jgi:hypothetical protein
MRQANGADALEYWKAQPGLQHSTNNPLKTPVEVALREAVRASFFVKRRWNSTEKLPGLNSIPDLSLSLADDLVSLVRALYEVQFLLLLEEEASVPGDHAPLQEMRFVIVEMKAALTYLSRGGPPGLALPEAEVRRIEKLNALPEHKREDEASLRLLIQVYLDVAERQRALLASLTDSFDLTLIERAKELLSLQDERIKHGTAPAAGSVMGLYYGLLSLLTQQLQQARAAARYVFRRHPKIVQEVTSTYQRQRVRKAYHTKKKQEK